MFATNLVTHLVAKFWLPTLVLYQTEYKILHICVHTVPKFIDVFTYQTSMGGIKYLRTSIFFHVFPLNL